MRICEYSLSQKCYQIYENGVLSKQLTEVGALEGGGEVLLDSDIKSVVMW